MIGKCEEDDIDKMMLSIDEMPSIRRMTFEMWVGMPDKVLKSLHNYTRISDQNHPSPKVKLESYDNWENLFPDLKVLLEEDEFGIVLLKSRFNLMSDYPPATSKLVLDLDLDFRHYASGGSSGSWMKYFTSINHLYHNGKKLRQTEHKDCLAIEPGVVKPFFEAEWWATQFTEVTRKMKEAEETKDPTATSDATEYSRSLFRGLTIMQEIFVAPQHSECMSSKLKRKRVAVLLWVFAQTNRGNAGVTTWQHVTVQREWFSKDQTSMEQDTCLPHLAMDNAVDDPFSIDTTGNGFDLDTMMPMSPIPYESGAYYSGFTPYHMHQEPTATYDFSGMTGFTPRTVSFTEVKPDPVNLILPLNLIPPFLPSQSMPDDKSGLFALSTQPLYEDLSGPGPATYDMSESLSVDQPLRRDSLAHFDMSTHDMLQAQLGDFDEPHDTLQSLGQIDQRHDTLQSLHDMTENIKDPDSQQSMIGHMHSLELDEEELSQAMLTDDCPITPTLDHHKLMLEHPTIFDSPKLTRPPLMAHNSFAGVMPGGLDMENEPLHFDTPTRNEFARVISGQLEAQDEDLFGNDMVMEPFEFGRPRSQPVLSSNDHGYSRSDPVCLGSPV